MMRKLIKYGLIFFLVLIWILLLCLQIIPLEFRSNPKDFTSVNRGLLPAISYRIEEHGSWIETKTTGNNYTPVIAMHGTPGSADNFIGIFQSPIFKDRFKGYALDRLGFGYNRYGESFFSLNEQSEFTARFISEELDQPPILIAHSYGVPVALQLAEQYPDKIRHLILIAGPISAQYEKSSWYRPLLNAPIIKQLLPESLYLCNVEMQNLPNALETIERNLDQIRTSITLIHGQDDMLVNHKNALYLKSKLSEQVNLISLPEENHFIPWSKPELVIDILETSTPSN